MNTKTNHSLMDETFLAEQQRLSICANDERLMASAQAKLKDFLQQGLPARRDEAWKYTPVTAALQNNHYQIASSEIGASNSLEQLDLSSYQLVDTYCLVFINGQFSLKHSKLDGLATGVTLTTAKQSSTVSTMQYLRPTVFADLNQALLTDGLSLELAKEVELDKPLHLLFINSSAQQAMHHPRHRIHLSPLSQATLIEEYIGIDCDYFNNIVTEINLDTSASLRHYKIQRESKAVHVANTQVKQAKDSYYFNFLLSLGARLSRDDLQIALDAPGATNELLALYLPAAGQHIDCHTRMEHNASMTTSQQLVKGLVGDRGRAVFNGQVYVPKNVKQINADQTNHNLLLGERAEVDTKPELEVYAEDVKCSHGATVGQLADEAVFYCQSRGIPLQQAKVMLMQAFADEMIAQVSDENMVNYLGKLVRQKLAQLIDLGETNG